MVPALLGAAAARAARPAAHGSPVVALIAIAAGGAWAQQATGPLRTSDFVHETWTMEDGLPISHLNGVLQARDGYLWMPSFDGLIRFDGVRFTVLSTATNPELPTNRFTSIAEGPDGSIWAAAEYDFVVRYTGESFEVYGPVAERTGVSLSEIRFDEDGVLWARTVRGVYVLREGRFEPLDHESLYGAVTVAFLREPSGVVWLGTDGGGALRWDGREVRRVIEQAPAPLGTLASSFVAMPDGTVYIATGVAVSAYRGGAVERLVPDGFDTFYPRALLPLGGDSVLVVSNRGLFLLRGNDLSLRSADITQTSSGGAYLAGDRNGSRWLAVGNRLYRDERLVFMSGLRIAGMTFDHEGSLWIAADGLHRLKRGIFHVYGEAEGSYANVYPIIEDRRGRIWIGSLASGVAVYANGTFRRLEGVPGLMQSILEDRDGRIWLGWIGGVCLFGGNRCEPRLPVLSGLTVKAVFQDRHGAMWFGTNQGLFRSESDTVAGQFTVSDGLPHNFVRVIHEARDGAMWFGTNGGGLARYANGQFESFGVGEGLSSDLVRFIHEDSSGVLWIGTEDRGLNRIALRDGGGGVPPLAGAGVTVIGRRHGLHADGIHAILDDGYGRFWMSSNSGIFWVPRAELEDFAAGRSDRVHSRSYDERDGLRNREANGGVQSPAIIASDGRLWFATQAGAAVVDPSAIGGPDVPLRVRVEAVRAGGRADRSDRVSLAARERDFEVAYTALSFLAPENLRFRYRLEGFQDAWVDAGNRRTAFFTNVPPGTYTFRVAASTGVGGEAAGQASVRVAVAPFLFETLWFRLVVLLTVVGGIVATVRSRVAFHRRRQVELAQLVDERTNQLREEQQTTEAERREAERHRDRAEQALDAVQAQAERLRRLDAIKTRFFGNVSHEFRTPLTLTIGPLEDLRDGRHGVLPDGAVGDVDLALRNSRRLLKMVNELLDIAKLEAGEMKLRAVAGDVWEFVGTAGEAFQSLAERREIDFRIERPQGPLELSFDPDLVERVVGNLLSNAFKFTPQGGTVRLRMSEADDETLGGTAEIEVRDSGPGIPDSELGQVFDRFHQVNESGARFQPGTGIGLSLAKELVELHGGHISVESAAGFGTTFRVRLPRARPGGQEAALPRIASSARPAYATLPPDLSARAPSHDPPDVTEESQEDRTTLLVVDDSADMRAYVREHLSADYRVIEAEDGEAAVAAVRRDIPDLVLCDIMMPKTSGWDVLRTLRSDTATDFIPVILLTARASTEQRIEGLDLGADDYLTKPFSMQELRARVGNLIASRRRLRDRFRSRDLPASERPAEDSFVGRVRQAVLDHIDDDEFGVEQLAREMSLSRSHLYRKVHELTGVAVSDFVRTVRLDRAATLLRAGAGNVGEVAYAVGFKSLSHFSRSFHQEFGVAPSAYLKDRAARPG